MSRQLSDETKIKRHMGTGEGAEYKPWILPRDFNSIGTTALIKDWKTGRMVSCLSQAEERAYYILRWDDNNKEVYDQYPLDNDLTVKIADELGVKHPYSRDHIMTTDFVAVQADGSYHAYAVKSDRDFNKRSAEILTIEKLYWIRLGQDFDILYKTEINEILSSNIRQVVKFYNEGAVFDEYSRLKHLIARKELGFDMEHVRITNMELDKLKRGGNKK